MRKILFVCMVICAFFLVGCGKYTEKEIVNDLQKKLDKAKTYYLQGELEIINNEESYKYDVEVSYQKEDNYRVSLTNKSNDHNQIILKNAEGVYVLTPSLNKTFKFESEWPSGSSQIYLLQSIVSDLNNDEAKTLKVNKNTYVLTSKVTFPNNKDLTKQIVTMDKRLNIQKVEIADKDSKIKMTMKFKDIDYKANFKNNYFDLETNNSTSKLQEPASSIEDAIYPMYLPANTKLLTQETISKVNGERVIMTFSGEKSFILVEETIEVSNDLNIIPTFGEPIVMANSIGSISDKSLTWSEGGVDYYLTSDVLEQSEMLKIAQSVAAIPITK